MRTNYWSFITTIPTLIVIVSIKDFDIGAVISCRLTSGITLCSGIHKHIEVLRVFIIYFSFPSIFSNRWWYSDTKLRTLLSNADFNSECFSGMVPRKVFRVLTTKLLCLHLVAISFHALCREHNEVASIFSISLEASVSLPTFRLFLSAGELVPLVSVSAVHNALFTRPELAAAKSARGGRRDVSWVLRTGCGESGLHCTGGYRTGLGVVDPGKDEPLLEVDVGWGG